MTLGEGRCDREQREKCGERERRQRRAESMHDGDPFPLTGPAHPEAPMVPA